MGSVGRSLAFRSRRHRAIFHLGSSFRAIAVHEGDGVLVLRRGVGGRIGSIFCHPSNFRAPTGEGVGVFSRSSLRRIRRLLDVGSNGTVIILCRSLQNRTVFIHEGNGVLVQGRRIGRNIGSIVHYIHKFRRPSRKFIGVFRISGLRRSRRLYNIGSQGSKIILRSFLENRSQIIIHKGDRKLSLGSNKLGCIIGVLRDGYQIGIPAVKSVGVPSIHCFNGSCAGIDGKFAIGHRFRRKDIFPIQETNRIGIYNCIKISHVRCIFCCSRQCRSPALEIIGVLGGSSLSGFVAGICRNRSFFHFYRLQNCLTIHKRNSVLDNTTGSFNPPISFSSIAIYVLGIFVLTIGIHRITFPFFHILKTGIVTMIAIISGAIYPCNTRAVPRRTGRGFGTRAN